MMLLNRAQLGNGGDWWPCTPVAEGSKYYSSNQAGEHVAVGTQGGVLQEHSVIRGTIWLTEMDCPVENTG